MEPREPQEPRESDARPESASSVKTPVPAPLPAEPAPDPEDGFAGWVSGSEERLPEA